MWYFYTLRLGFPQIRYFTKLIHNLQTASVNNKGVSAFGALCSAIGSEVGAGSLVGVATALASGGPGAIFWMWVTAILGMPIMFGEAVLAQLFVSRMPTAPPIVEARLTISAAA